LDRPRREFLFLPASGPSRNTIHSLFFFVLRRRVVPQRQILLVNRRPFDAFGLPMPFPMPTVTIFFSWRGRDLAMLHGSFYPFVSIRPPPFLACNPLSPFRMTVIFFILRMILLSNPLAHLSKVYLSDPHVATVSPSPPHKHEIFFFPPL